MELGLWEDSRTSPPVIFQDKLGNITVILISLKVWAEDMAVRRRSVTKRESDSCMLMTLTFQTYKKNQFGHPPLQAALHEINGWRGVLN